ncbi:MAG: CDP-glucose 4,6-dehydratase [Gammaproteobacteria bacterium]
MNSFRESFKGRRVFVTGHTGFKGSWLCQWLLMLGAEVKGYALAPDKAPSHFALLELPMESELGDIRDARQLARSIANFRPEFIFHLAAQPLVKRSYNDPVETYSTNVMGLVNVLDAALAAESVLGVLNVTSDKCYENRHIATGYRESDPMGGHDPYSASKGCAELITASYRRSFYEPAGKLLASARAGNVVGGGDWSDDRLVPDVIRAIERHEPVRIRRPGATRPWQHVLEPLRGYLILATRMLAGDRGVCEGWNFGTMQLQGCSVSEVLACMHRCWPAFDVEFAPEEATFHEAELLQLNSEKAAEHLQWHPLLSTPAAFEMTMGWYRDFYTSRDIATQRQIRSYDELMRVEPMPC